RRLDRRVAQQPLIDQEAAPLRRQRGDFLPRIVQTGAGGPRRPKQGEAGPEQHGQAAAGPTHGPTILKKKDELLPAFYQGRGDGGKGRAGGFGCEAASGGGQPSSITLRWATRPMAAASSAMPRPGASSAGAQPPQRNVMSFVASASSTRWRS